MRPDADETRGPLLIARELTCRRSGTEVVHGVALSARAGSVTAILGPNGAGKSTLLRALAGLGEWSGELMLGGRSLRLLSRKAIAREVALVDQDPPCDAPFTVSELVLMGRAPHLGRFGLVSARDRAIAREAMRQADVAALAARPIDQLSGGERRRAFLARALAQQPKILLLDEPTAFLDLGHQAKILEHACALARAGLCVLAVLHDPNLAASFADALILMRAGRIVSAGPAREVLTAPALSELYETPLEEITQRGALLFAHLRSRREELSGS